MMQIPIPVFRVIVAGCVGLILAPLLQAQVPDCANFKQAESQSKAPRKPIVPESKILHFCSPNRIPGQFIVKIKDNDDLAAGLSPSAIKTLGILPGLVPDTKEKCTSLARALAEKYHGKLSMLNCADDARVFSIYEMSDEAAAALAHDPRIEYLEPNMRIGI
jgi:hypothetical protein